MCYERITQVTELFISAPPVVAALSRYLRDRGVPMSSDEGMIVSRGCRSERFKETYYVDPETNQRVLIEDDSEE